MRGAVLTACVDRPGGHAAVGRVGERLASGQALSRAARARASTRARPHARAWLQKLAALTAAARRASLRGRVSGVGGGVSCVGGHAVQLVAAPTRTRVRVRAQKRERGRQRSGECMCACACARVCRCRTRAYTCACVSAACPCPGTFPRAQQRNPRLFPYPLPRAWRMCTFHRRLAESLAPFHLSGARARACPCTRARARERLRARAPARS